MIEASECGVVAILADGVDLVFAENVVCETSQPSEEAGVAADSGVILAHGYVAGVVGSVLDAPMAADSVCEVDGGGEIVGKVERDLGGGSPQAGFCIAGGDFTLDADDGADKVMPFGVGEGVLGVEHADGSDFVAVSRVIASGNGIERQLCGASKLGVLEQGRLIVFDLNDQLGVGCDCGLEGFFWQCMASRVTIRRSTSSSLSSV
jgi:hypothetical protein